MSKKKKRQSTKPVVAPEPSEATSSGASPTTSESPETSTETRHDKRHTMTGPSAAPPPGYYPAPPSFRVFSFLFQVGLSVGITLLALHYAPTLFLGSLARVGGKPAASCKVKQVRYDPVGNAVVSFQCGEQEKDVTVARGKQGPQGESCAMKVERSQGNTTLVFRCGSQTERVSLPSPQAAGNAVAQAPRQTAPAPRPIAQPRPQPRVVQARVVPRGPAARPAPPARRAQVVARVAPPRREPPQPAPRVVARRPAPRVAARRPAPVKVAARSAPQARPHDHKHDHNHDHGHDHGKAKAPSWDKLTQGSQSISLRGAPMYGPASAKVRVVVFSDFQCPFCARGVNILDRIKRAYKGQVRIMFKHLPLSFHKQAHLAAQAAMAAHAQGKFWAYHDKLFAHQSRLKKEDLIEYARELKLDVQRFTQDLTSQKYKKYVDTDLIHAGNIGAQATPTFFINDKKIIGAQPFSTFSKEIDRLLGIKRSPDEDADGDVERVGNIATKGAPSWGPKNAKITIVEFSDFQCPFCASGSKVVKRIKEAYKNVRIVYKHMPLQNHSDADLAAQASMAANEQGKFWEYHDKLFKNQDKLKPKDLLRYAKELGLDMKKFNDALNNAKYRKHVDADIAEAQRLGVNGTPIFFINGFKIPGALPFSYFEKVIAATLANKTPPKFRPPPRNQEGPKGRQDIPVSEKDPILGPSNAPITIVEFSDFECKYCSRGGRIMKALRQYYGDKVRIVFKHKPLPNHPNAHIAAQASMAAHAQGKFWEFHNELFKNSENLGMNTYVRIARKVGLDVQRFEKELKAGTYRMAVEKDRQLADKAGVDSTPMFFINGHPLLGAQPMFQFQVMIDAILANKPVPKIGLMPPKNPRNIKVSLRKNDASFGPKSSHVTIVQFSDFECGYCQKASSVVNRLKKVYGKQIRFVYKHLPIKSHKDAHLAAQASMAANEQGKFWEYHDLLFKNQRNLKRADLIKYAQQLNLDTARFTKVLDTGKYKDLVEDDYEQARWWGIDATPTYVINGEKMVGAVTFDKIKQKLDNILYTTPAK